MCCGPLAKFLEMFAETSRLWWSASPSDAPRAVRWTGAISCYFPRSAYLWSRWSWASRRKRSTNWHGMKEETSSAGLCARRLESTVRVTWPCCRHTCWNDTVNICTGLYYFVCVCVCRYVAEGTVMSNYADVLSILMRLRQHCCHPDMGKALTHSDKGAMFFFFSF